MRDEETAAGVAATPGTAAGQVASGGAARGSGAERSRRPGGRAGERQGDFFGPVARSFAQPALDAGRIGVVDVGSNSVRMVVFEGGRRCPAMLFNEKVMCGLGAELVETGRLAAEGRARAMAVLRRFAAIADAMQVEAMAGVATAAIRDAADGAAFRAAVEAETGIRLAVATGDEEARLSAQGVLYGAPDAEGVVADLGGASMELCRIGAGRIGAGITTPLGPLRLSAIEGRPGAADAEILRRLAAVPPSFELNGGRLYLVGGAWRALMRAGMERAGYPLKVLHEYTLAAQPALELAAWAAAASPRELAQMPGVADGRAGTVPHAARLLAHVVRRLEPGLVVVSAFGLREGVCLEHMPPALRALDPLLAAAEAEEQRRARAPGFGAELAAFVAELVPPADAREARLLTAAAHLSDVCWRAHPDHRALSAWETVTRVGLTGAGHGGRLTIGAALAIRYKRGRKTLDALEPMRLLSETEIERAIEFGLALRVGCDLAANLPGILPDVAIERAGDAVTLVLDGRAREMGGEEVEKRLAHLAQATGRRLSIQLA